METQGIKDAYKDCPYCKKKFYIPFAQEWGYRVGDRAHRVDYCSWKCLRAAERKKKEKETIRYCIQCGKVLTGRSKKFCDILCSQDYRAMIAQEKCKEKTAEKRRLRQLQAVC